MLKIFVFIDIWFVKQAIQKWLKQRYAVFMKNLKIKRKKDKTFLTFRSGDLNPRFSVIFPPMIWIFMENEGDEIKSKQASKRDRTLISRIFDRDFTLCRNDFFFFQVTSTFSKFYIPFLFPFSFLTLISLFPFYFYLDSYFDTNQIASILFQFFFNSIAANHLGFLPNFL